MPEGAARLWGSCKHYGLFRGEVKYSLISVQVLAQSWIECMFPYSYTAVDYAELNNHGDCAQVLREKGGLSINAIKEKAAIYIQSVYRGYRFVCFSQDNKLYEISPLNCYRARVLRSKLAMQKSAATTITAYLRGLLQRRKFEKLKQKHRAAIAIQAYAR